MLDADMKKRPDRSRGISGFGRHARLYLALGSVLVVVIGAGTMVRGGTNYLNWWGGLVFAPAAILIGALGLFIAIFRPGAAEPANKKSRIRGWPVGRRR
jgi:hypothetical protein